MFTYLCQSHYRNHSTCRMVPLLGLDIFGFYECIKANMYVGSE